jgi:DNA primase
MNHTCGDGKTLLVSREASALRSWCFRCNTGESIRPPEETLEETLTRIARHKCADAAVGDKAPEPRNYDVGTWAPKAALWLYKAGLGVPEIAKLGAYYHEPTGRVVVPVSVKGVEVFWQARSVDGRVPKYLAPQADKGRILVQHGEGPFIVLTEDHLSAFKVGLIACAWALMGTKASDALMHALMQDGRHVVLALDNDKAGIAATAKIRRSLSGFGIKHRVLHLPDDPKRLHLSYLKRVLYDEP